MNSLLKPFQENFVRRTLMNAHQVPARTMLNVKMGLTCISASVIKHKSNIILVSTVRKLFVRWVINISVHCEKST